MEHMSKKELKRKRRERESEASEDGEQIKRRRNTYYKNLRKAQKKRRKERKKIEAAGDNGRKEDETVVVKPDEIEPQSPHNNRKERRDAHQQDLSRGRQMVSAALTKKTEEGRDKKQFKKTTQATKASKGYTAQSSYTALKEIDPANLRRELGAKPIGSGTFGTCFLAKYREITVVVKEYKRAECSTKGDSFERRRKEAAHEARVIQQLGDHPGIPLLFGVISQQQPVSIVLKFHGDGIESLTLYKAAKRRKIAKEDWKKIFCDVADALQHIHRCGYIHNDLKSNNVVLETNDSSRPKPVIIDFGKSVLAVNAKKPNAKPLYVREQYKNSYIAPELIDGTSKPSAKTDIFALCFLIKSVYGLLKFDLPPIVRNALTQPPESRPSIEILKESLTE